MRKWKLRVPFENAIRDKSQYVLKSEHESMLRQREEDLVADMRNTFRLGTQTCVSGQLRPSKQPEQNIVNNSLVLKKIGSTL